MSSQRLARIGVSIFGSVVSMALSWPYWRDFEYWAESREMWLLYFAAGFVLAVYVFYVFLGTLSTLFEHDAIDRARRGREAGSREGTP